MEDNIQNVKKALAKEIESRNTVGFKVGEVCSLKGVLFKIKHVSPKQMVLKPFKKGIAKV